MPNDEICQGMFRKIVAFLHARAKAALVQPQSEREAVLTGREPSQAMGTICESRRGVRLPCRRCRPSSILSLKPHPYLALDKADGVTALALGAVELLVAADGDAGVVGGTILSAGANGALALSAQQRYHVGILRPRLFLRREINKFSHPFFSVWIDVVPLAARGTLWYNFSP